MTHEIWNFIAEKLQANQSVMLQIVTSHHGSSPGKTSFKMAHCLNGDTVGSVGGGIMEHHLMQQGLKILELGVKKHSIKIMEHRSDVINPNAVPSGLICAGTQTVQLIPLYPERAREFHEVCSALHAGKETTLICRDNSLSFQPSSEVSNQSSGYVERLNRTNEIFIFGDGHIGNALALVLRQLKYEYYQFPSPRDGKTLTDVSEKKKSFSDLIKQSMNAYAVIVTSAGDTDLECLRKLIPYNLKYCGVMGSAAKLKYLMEHLRQESVKPKWLNRIHAPIGLKIGSQTPAEIAISIAAELISVMRS